MKKAGGGTSPTRRSLEWLRNRGYIAAVVEKWNPHARIRQDLFGFADLIAFREREVLLVQCTTTDVKSRVEKIEANDIAREWQEGWPQRRIVVHGWRKVSGGKRGGRKTWQLREVEL